jgi:Zn ribbon nucleic-acid-binding protein
MEATRYQIVLKGELMDGYDAAAALQALAKLFGQPPERLRGIFGGKPITLRQELDLERARQIQARLHSLGIKCLIQPVGGLAVEAPVPERPAAGANLALQSACPKCGHHLTRADKCVHCGIVPAEWDPEASPETDPDEQLLQIFVDSNGEKYAAKFRRFYTARGYAFTWHWPALFVPVFWAIYRRLWGWAAIMFVSMIVPFAFLVWPATANYIYYRHAKKELARLGPSARVNVVAAAGGTDAKAVWMVLGVVFLLAGGAGVVLKKNVDSANFYAHAAEKTKQDIPDTAQGRRTLAVLRLAALNVDEWQQRGNDVGTVSLEKLLVDLNKNEEEFLDGWGNPVRVSPTPDAFMVTSPGPDGVLDTADDIRFEPDVL